MLNNDIEVMEEGFKIQDLNKAIWVFELIKKKKDKKREIEEVAAENIKRFNDWKEKECKQYDDDIRFFEMKLQEYYREQRATDPKFKLSTPYGTVSSRKSTNYNYYDEDTCIAYLEEIHSPALVVEEVKSIDKRLVRQLLKNGVNPETGEIVPGLEVEQVESITVKID